MNRIAQFGAVLRVTLNNNFGLSYGRHVYLVQKKRLWEPVIIAVSIGSLAVLWGFGYFKLLNVVYDQMAMLGQTNSILAMGAVASQLIVLVFGIFWVTAIFYFSRDLSILLPLPIPPSTVLLAKFIAVLVNEYITIFLIMVPPIWVFGFRAGMGFGYWIMAIMVFLLLPIIPLGISSIASILLMRYANLKKSGNLIMFLGTLAFLAAYLGFQYYVMRMPGQSEEEVLRMLLTMQDAVARQVAGRFPPSMWAAMAMARPFSAAGLVEFAKFLGLSLIMLAVVWFAAEKMFYAGVASGTEVTKSESRRKRGLDSLVQRSPEWAMALKDHLVFVRTPVFILNSGVGALIFPGLLAVWFIAGRDGEMFRSIPGLAAFLTNPGTEIVRMLGFALILIWNGATTMTAQTCFSREGANFWVLKAIPVDPRRQVMGKVLYSLMFQAAASALMIIVLQAILGMSLRVLGLGILLAAIGILASTFLCTLIDMLRPYLRWDNPQKAMKSNLNALFGWVLIQAILAGVVFAAVKMFAAGWSQSVIVSLAFVSGFGLAAIGYLTLMARAVSAFRAVEM